MLFYFYYFYLIDSKWMITTGVEYLHMTDDLNIKDYKHNLIALWAKCITNSYGWTKYYDKYVIDFLPNYTRITAKWPLSYMWLPTMIKSKSTITRLDLMDSHLLRIFKLCQNEYQYKDLQIVIVGAGFDTKFCKYQQETERPKHLHFIEIDLPNIIDFKQKLCQRLRKRHPQQNIKLPNFIAADLLKSKMKDLLTKENGFNNKMPTVFIFEAILCYLNVQKEPQIVNTIMDDISNICKDLPNSFMIIFDAIPSISDTATIPIAEEYFNSIGFNADYIDLTRVPSMKLSSISGAFSRIPKLVSES